MENNFQFLECEGVQIAAFIEARSEEEHPFYFPMNILFYVKKGKQHIRIDNDLHTVVTEYNAHNSLLLKLRKIVSNSSKQLSECCGFIIVCVVPN